MIGCSFERSATVANLREQQLILHLGQAIAKDTAREKWCQRMLGRPRDLYSCKLCCRRVFQVGTIRIYGTRLSDSCFRLYSEVCICRFDLCYINASSLDVLWHQGSDRMYSHICLLWLSSLTWLLAYTNELERSLEFIRITPELTVDEKRQFFRSANTNLGRVPFEFGTYNQVSFFSEVFLRFVFLEEPPSDIVG